MPRTALLLDDEFKKHQPGPGHPECPERYDAVRRGLQLSGVIDAMPRVPARLANTDELLLGHTPDYLRTLDTDFAHGVHDLSTGDTAVGPGSREVALRAVGGVLNAVDAVMAGDAAQAFCAVRPPGHHATPTRGMGFCIYNNVAIAARYAQKKHGLERVLIADWDVHHGNGTQDIFYEDGSVFFFSTHQHPWYPGTGMVGETGEGQGKRTTLNAPLPAGSGQKEIIGAFRDRLLPAAAAFRPDIVFLSAGFDSRRGDPLGRFQLSDDDFATLTRLMQEIAGLYSGGRLISVLEGGYDLEGLESAVTAHTRTLAE